jgi:hypothetical protein
VIHYTRKQPAPHREASVVTWGAPNAAEDLRSLGVNVLQFTSFVYDTPDDTSVSTPSVTLHGIVSFFFNVAVIALTVGLVGDAIQN